MEEKDLDDLAKKLDEKRKNRWYSDPEKAKKYGPLLETILWIMGMGIAFALICLAFVFFAGPNNFSDDSTTPILIQNMDCYSLQQALLDLNHQPKNHLGYSSVINMLNNEINARCQGP